MTKLSDIVQIQTGVYMQPDAEGNAVYIQVKDVDESGTLLGGMKPQIFLNEKQSHHILEPGDVLFAAKGDKNIATVFKGLPFPAVASSSFFVIKFSSKVLPEYLAWFLNLPLNQKKLKAEAKGTSIPSISLKTLEELQVKIVTKKN